MTAADQPPNPAPPVHTTPWSLPKIPYAHTGQPANHIISISGGKDSTAMALLAYHSGINIFAYLHFGTDWDHPTALWNLIWLHHHTGVDIYTINPPETFEYYLLRHPVVKRGAPEGTPPHRHGYGWPSWTTRWCTRQKINALNAFGRATHHSLTWIGITADEKRPHGIQLSQDGNTHKWTPLHQANITAEDTLKICRHYGARLGDHYDHFPRLGCFCCPLAPIATHRLTRRLTPHLWQTTLDMDAHVDQHPSSFTHGKTACQLDRMFKEEDKQTSLNLSKNA